MDLLRAQAKGQEFDEAKARDKIEAQLEREMVREMLLRGQRGRRVIDVGKHHGRAHC